MDLAELDLPADLEYKFLINQEELVLEVTELLHKLIKDGAVERSELASLLNIDRKVLLAQLKRDDMSLRLLADIALILGYRIEISATLIEKEQNGRSRTPQKP